MIYSNVDFNVVYVDPSIETPGDGTTPESALKTLPAVASDFINNTCYLIRRTSEEAAVIIPNGENTNITNLLLLGMPDPSDLMYDFVPEEAKSAWGADSAKYANVKSVVADGRFQLPNLRVFLMHRIYLFRDGIESNNYMLYFYNSSDYKMCISFEHCKFGSRGIDVDNPEYSGEALTQSRLKSYVYIYYARMLNIRDCVINYAITGNSSNCHGIYCRFPEILHVENVKVCSPLNYSSYGYYPLCLSENSDDGIECEIRNVSQEIIFNGTYEYIPSLLRVSGYLNARIRNISVSMADRGLSEVRPANLYLQNNLIYFSYMRDFTVSDITVNIPRCWRCTAPAVGMYDCYSSNYVPGIEKDVRNITINLCEDEANAIGTPISYSDASNSGSSYVALFLEFDRSDSGIYAKVPVVDNITVRNPRGRSLYICNARLTNAQLKGSMTCYYTVADIDKLETWFPGYALWAYDGSHVRVKDMFINIDNPAYLYSQEPAVGTDFNNRANVFVDKCNIALRPLTYRSDNDCYIYQGFGCNNEGEEGHFCFRCPNGIADTWSVHRTGGGAAALKLYNNNFNTTRTMVLGRKPFKGMELLPTTSGRHILKIHIAYKGYADDADMFRRLMISATVRDGDGNDSVYWSTLHGRWVDDSASEWINDENLTQKCLEIPLDLIENNPVDVRVYFSWFSSSGFVYIDPALELEPVVSE